MLLIERLAEEQIVAAIRRGELDGLPGMGMPLELEDDSAVPEELRVAYRLLRNAGCLPAEQALRQEVHRLEDLLDGIATDEEDSAVRRRLWLLRTQLALRGQEINLLLQESAYREKLLKKLQPESR